MRTILLIICLILPANFAHATPPQVVEISETLLGVNDTHIFVLRRLDDNMGRYQPTQTDVVLIARNRRTNVDDQVWPVMRMLDSGYDLNEHLIEAQIKPLPLQDRVNPFDVLLWRKARPLFAPLGTWKQDPDVFKMSTERKDGALTIMAENGKYYLADTAMATALASSIESTRNAMPPYFTEGRGDAMMGIKIDPAQECKYHNFTRFSEMENKKTHEHWIAYVTCDSEYALSYLSMFLVVPQVK